MAASSFAPKRRSSCLLLVRQIRSKRVMNCRCEKGCGGSATVVVAAVVVGAAPVPVGLAVVEPPPPVQPVTARAVTRRLSSRLPGMAHVLRRSRPGDKFRTGPLEALLLTEELCE